MSSAVCAFVGMKMNEVLQSTLLMNLNREQRDAVCSPARLLGVVAGAGSGKTEVMSRRVAWWVGIEGVDRSKIVAFTFTEAAAEELKFRIREKLQILATGEEDEEATLSGMSVGTIHAFCLKCLREFAPDEFYSFDVLDDAGRMSLIQRGFFNPLALAAFRQTAEDSGAALGQYNAVNLFVRSYDIINEHVAFGFRGPDGLPPRIETEQDWCREFVCNTNLGSDALSQAFATSAARYYAYLRARRFLDFSTAQAEFVRKLGADSVFRDRFLATYSHLVIDEVQDINPAQLAIIETMVNAGGRVTAVGDHRQAIYSFRGGRVDLMGELFREFALAADGVVKELPANFRSTQRIIDVANAWSDTITDTAGMAAPAMVLGVQGRADEDPHHVLVHQFCTRDDEANWIAQTIQELVPPTTPALGAAHGEGENRRGISYGDVAILVRSATDISVYKDTLRGAGIPAVVRGGADLFSQIEVIVGLSALSLVAGMGEFYGGAQNKSLVSRVQTVLGITPPRHEQIIPSALNVLAARGLNVAQGAAARVVNLANLLHRRVMEEGRIDVPSVANVRTIAAKQWIRSSHRPRRIFPQTIFQWLLEEMDFGEWGDAGSVEYETVRFHIGQLSALLKGMESSGWTSASDAFKHQLIGLMMWGASSAKIPEAPLLAPPNAVSVTTVHSAKGLEFPAVFVADVCARRFPSQRARTQPRFAFDIQAAPQIDPTRLADNANNDDERRLLYVAITRAERFLFITSSGRQRSQFFKEIGPLVRSHGGFVGSPPASLVPTLEYLPRTVRRDQRLATSFSDIRYYLECPQDFYIRKVLGFTPPVGQEFGYGRGVHNLLRAVHNDPAGWAALNSEELRTRAESLVDAGLFYLRHTVGDPYENLKNKAVRGVIDYVKSYKNELEKLEFEPEKPFETLFPEEGVLISGAIDLVRLNDPPRVTLIDFKSGNAAGDNTSGLSTEMMEMQLSVYGIAARKELEYEPDEGLIRYIGEDDATKKEVGVALNEEQLQDVRQRVVHTAQRIKAREFHQGPTPHHEHRCKVCDWSRVCPMPLARSVRTGAA